MLAQEPGPEHSRPEPEPPEPSRLVREPPEPRSDLPERELPLVREPPPEPERARSDCTRQGKSRLQARQVLSETSFGNSYAGENGNAVFRIGVS